MKLTILGSGTSIIKKDRLAPGYLVELNSGESFLFDCGGTVAQRFANIKFDYLGLDHIFISHPHPDHLGGLISFLHGIVLKSMYFGCLGKKRRKKKLLLHGYPGFVKAYKSLRKLIFSESIETYPIKVMEYKNQKVRYPGFIIKTAIVPHAEKLFKSLALRLEADGKIFFYSGDTRYSKQLVKLAENADLALIDSSGLGAGLGEKGYHITPEGAGKVAQEARVKKLIPTHHYDVKPAKQILQEAKKYFSGEIVLAEDLMVIKI